MRVRTMDSRNLLFLAAALAAAAMSSPRSVSAETIQLLGPGGPVTSNSTFSALVVLRDNVTPLAGYTLDVDIAGEAGSFGTLTGNAGLSNFFLSRNLIDKDPTETLHPLFSLIAPAMDGGVLVNAQSLSGMAVDPALPGFSDVLAQVFFDVPADAYGTFHISFGPATTLFDGASSVPFDASGLAIEVVPEPAGLAVAVLGCLLAGRRRRWQ